MLFEKCTTLLMWTRKKVLLFMCFSSCVYTYFCVPVGTLHSLDWTDDGQLLTVSTATGEFALSTL